MVPVVGPALLLAAGSTNFMFDGPGWIDAFGMVGRFWHYTSHNPLFEEYQWSRLPWILPGFVLHHLFDAVTASYILHTTNLIAASLAVYLILRDTLQDRLIAAVIGAAWSSYTWVHGSGGWNYHVAAASTYYLWGLWLLVRSTTAARRGFWLLGSGAMLVSAVHTHIVFAGFIPIAALLLVPASHPRGWASWCQAAGYVFAGAVSATLLLGAVNAATGGSWFFFLPQVEYTLDFVGRGNRWLLAPATWMPTASYLVIPTLALVAAVPWLANVWRGYAVETVESRFALVLVVQGFLAFGLMVYLQFGGGQTALDHPHFAFPLYCHTFPMIGALLWSSRRTDRNSGLVFAGALACTIAGLLLLLPSQLARHPPAFANALHLRAPIVLAPFLLGVAALPLGLLPRRARLTAFAIVFGLLNAGQASAAVYRIGDGGINRDMLVVFRSLDRFMTAVDPSLFSIRYWGEPGIVAGRDGPTNMADVFRSFLAIRRRSLITVAYDRPDTRADELTVADLYGATCLGVLSVPEAHQALVDRLTRRFSELGIQWHPLGHHRADSGSFSIELTVLSAQPDNPQPGAVPCAPAP